MRASRRPGWLRVDRLLAEHGIPKDSAAGRRVFEARLEARRRQGEGADVWKPMRRGWCLGGKTFRKELLAQVSKRRGAHHYGAELQEEKAECVAQEELARQRWSERDLVERPKTDRRKARIARRLRRATSSSISSMPIWSSATLTGERKTGSVPVTA